MDPSERDAALEELARRVNERAWRGKGLVRIKLLLVDAGGDRHLVTLDPESRWALTPRNEHGELLFLEEIKLVGVERADPAPEEVHERPLEDVVRDLAGEDFPSAGGWPGEPGS